MPKQFANLMTLSKEDEAFMNRLFGKRIPEEMMTFMETAKGVSFKDQKDLGLALNSLVLNIAHKGIGEGAIGGWRYYKHNGEHWLEVCRIAGPKAKAA